MNSETPKLTITYFPYTFVYENELKSLILYFDTTRLLQVIPASDPGLPEMLRSSQLLQCFHPIADSTLLENVKKAYETYEQLKTVHQDGGLLQLLQTFALQEDFADSRPGLVAQIRQAHPRLAPEDVELINDAVFILLAHQFDHDNLELDQQLEQLSGLEARLHEEAGIGTDEERKAVAMSSAPVEESDHPRAQYPFQRLRAWTRLYCLQEETTPFPLLTTSAEVAGEIVERMPSGLTTVGETLPPIGVKQYSLAVLPDPQLLSLEQVQEFRQSLQEQSFLDTWRQSVLTAIYLLQETILEDQQWRELEKNLQVAAEGFQQRWPVRGKPSRYLQLKCFCHPEIKPEVALAKVTGLEAGCAKRHPPVNTNGIILLLSAQDV